MTNNNNPQPLTEDELAAIRTNLENVPDENDTWYWVAKASLAGDIPRLLATVGALQGRIRELEDAICGNWAQPTYVLPAEEGGLVVIIERCGFCGGTGNPYEPNGQIKHADGCILGPWKLDLLKNSEKGRKAMFEHDSGQKEAGAFKRARGLIPWQEGDIPSEVLIRRSRGDFSDLEEKIASLEEQLAERDALISDLATELCRFATPTADGCKFRRPDMVLDQHLPNCEIVRLKAEVARVPRKHQEDVANPPESP